MTNPHQSPWIHIGECPFCVDGICRIRTCQGGDAMHFYAMCDECDAMWTQPDTATKKIFPDPENPLCPVCGVPVHDEQSHFAIARELESTDWGAQAIYELCDTAPEVNSSNGIAGVPPSEEFLTVEDQICSLDAPPEAENLTVGWDHAGLETERTSFQPPIAGDTPSDNDIDEASELDEDNDLNAESDGELKQRK